MSRTAQRRYEDERVLQRKLNSYSFRKREWLLKKRKRLVMAVESRKDITWCRCDRCKNGVYRSLRQRDAGRAIEDYYGGQYE